MTSSPTQAAPSSSPAATPIPSQALRIALFGMPAAGKSSLLGALLQSSQTQEELLDGRLVDVSQGLAELQRRLYENQPQETTQEIVSYPVRLERGGGALYSAVLVDCDGRVANELVTRQRALGGASPNESLGAAILGADTLVLAVDASASPGQLQSDFVEFGRFLRVLEQQRGRRTEISGLPVFLVLTKCDLLAQASDSVAAWLERIEQRKTEVARRFQTFATHDGTRTPFGRIDLHVWATAVKRPVLKDSPARPRDPYGVAELFRQCFAAARAYRKRLATSRRRVGLTALSALVLVALLIALIVGVVSLHRQAPSRLETQVDQLHSRDQEQTPLAQHRNVQSKIDELNTIATDPVFVQLPPKKQDYVRERLDELKAYAQFQRAVQQITDPRDATSLAQLDQISGALSALAIPAGYAFAWRDTEAGRQQLEWQEDIAALRDAVQRVGDWYRTLTHDGEEVLAHAGEANLPTRARQVLDRASRPPFPEQDPDQTIPGSKRIRYRTVFRFAPVADARRHWDEVKKKLEPAARLSPS
jgi:GTPase SAR1 family protein